MSLARVIPLLLLTATCGPKPDAQAPVATPPVVAAAASQPAAPTAAAGTATLSEPLRADSMLSSAALTADLALLEETYRTLHPGLARYNTPAELDALFAAARAEFSRDRTVGEAFLVLTRLTAALRCGHSYPNFYNQAEPIVAALLSGPRLALTFRWLGDQMVVTRDLGTGANLPAGTVIERIGEVATVDLLRQLLPLARRRRQHEQA